MRSWAIFGNHLISDRLLRFSGPQSMEKLCGSDCALLQGCQKTAYKPNFKPAELWCPVLQQWIPFAIASVSLESTYRNLEDRPGEMALAGHCLRPGEKCQVPKTDAGTSCISSLQFCWNPQSGRFERNFTTLTVRSTLCRNLEADSANCLDHPYAEQWSCQLIHATHSITRAGLNYSEFPDVLEKVSS